MQEQGRKRILQMIKCPFAVCSCDPAFSVTDFSLSVTEEPLSWSVFGCISCLSLMSHFDFFQINFPNYVKAIQNLNAELQEFTLEGILVVVRGHATTALSMWLHCTTVKAL